MKIAFFPCLFLLLCAAAVTSRAAEVSQTWKNSEDLASAPEGKSESAVADIGGNNNKFELETKHFVTDSEKNQRGRGSNGGGIITRQPRTDKSSAVKLKRPFILISATSVISSVLLLLVLPFVIPRKF